MNKRILIVFISFLFCSRIHAQDVFVSIKQYEYSYQSKQLTRIGKMHTRIADMDPYCVLLIHDNQIVSDCTNGACFTRLNSDDIAELQKAYKRNGQYFNKRWNIGFTPVFDDIENFKIRDIIFNVEQFTYIPESDNQYKLDYYSLNKKQIARQFAKVANSSPLKDFMDDGSEKLLLYQDDKKIIFNSFWFESVSASVLNEPFKDFVSYFRDIDLVKIPWNFDLKYSPSIGHDQVFTNVMPLQSLKIPVKKIKANTGGDLEYNLWVTCVPTDTKDKDNTIEDFHFLIEFCLLQEVIIRDKNNNIVSEKRFPMKTFLVMDEKSVVEIQLSDNKAILDEMGRDIADLKLDEIKESIFLKPVSIQ